MQITKNSKGEDIYLVDEMDCPMCGLEGVTEMYDLPQYRIPLFGLDFICVECRDQLVDDQERYEQGGF